MHGGRPVFRRPDDFGHPGPQSAQRTQFGDGHELVVVGGNPETDLPQRIRPLSPRLAEKPQIRDARGNGAGQLPCRACSEVVQRGPVDRDRPHATGVPGDLRGDRDDIGDVGTGPLAQRRGQRIGAQVDRQPGALLVVHVGQQRQQGLRCGDESAPTSSITGTRSRNTPSRRRSSSAAATPSRAHSEHQRADPLGQRHQHRAVAVGDGLLAGRGKRFGDLPARLHVAQRVAAADERPGAGQRLLRRGVQAGVQRRGWGTPHRSANRADSRAPAAGRPDHAGCSSPTRQQRQSASAVPTPRKPDSCTSIRLNHQL